MSKRSDKFERNPRGLYPTPASAVRPLLRYLPDGVRFDEPCAGNGALVGHLEEAGHTLAFASDIHPMAKGITERDALDVDQCNGDMFITNPPWPEQHLRGDPALAILVHLSSLAPTWLLLPADFSHNLYFGNVESRCQKIVSVGRVKWISVTVLNSVVCPSRTWCSSCITRTRSRSGVFACFLTKSGLIRRRGWIRHSTAAVGTLSLSTMSRSRSNAESA